jgi:hypothetical protein
MADRIAALILAGSAAVMLIAVAVLIGRELNNNFYWKSILSCGTLGCLFAIDAPLAFLTKELGSCFPANRAFLCRRQC